MSSWDRDRFGRGKPASVRDALREIEKYAKVLEIDNAPQPILAGSVRRAIFEWLSEIRFAGELALAKITPRRSALLFGFPGTGKTTLAHHLSARLGKKLVCIESEGIIDCWVGSSAKNLGDVFDCLDALGDEVVCLFDEFDSIASRRVSNTGADKERTAMLNVMLRRMEQIKCITIAATNRHDSLDGAAWRRFGMQIDVALPDTGERRKIIELYADPFVLGDKDLDLLGDLTERASPSLLRQLMEGMKRVLVLGKHLKTDISQPQPVFEQIVSSIKPPPEFDPPPPLWADQRGIEDTAGIAWPPQRRED